MKEQNAQYVRTKIIEEYLKGESIRQIATACSCLKNMALKWVQIYKQEKEDEAEKKNNRISKNENGGFTRKKQDEQKDEKEIRIEATSIYLGRKKK